MRAHVIDAGFAVAARLNRFGLAPYTARARRIVARLGGDEHLVEVDGLTIGGSLADHGTYLRSLTGPGAHPFQLELFVDAIAPGSVVLDCGAHVGLHSMLAARRVGAGGTVIAVEPAPASAAALRANARENGFEQRIEVIEAAAADSGGTAPLHLHTALDQAGLIPLRGGVNRTIDVPRVPLDEVMGERRFDVAKIDVEGAEGPAIAGLERTLARSSGATLFVEVHSARVEDSGADPMELLRGLSERGKLELIDEHQRRLVPASEDELARAVREQPMAFNVRWTLD